MTRPTPPPSCKSCGEVGPEHWYWASDSRYTAGGKYICRIRKRRNGLNSVLRIKNDPERSAKRLERERRWCEKNAEYIRYKAYVQDDRRRGSVTILKEDALFLMSQPCFYCGLTPSGGLDRKDSSKGHEGDNVLPCCMKCNCILGDLPFEAKRLLGPGLRAITERGLLTDWIVPQLRRAS